MKNGDHTHWSEQLPAYVLGALSPAEKLDIEHHVEGCSECQAEMRWLDPAVEVLAESVPQVEPTSDLKSRIMADVAIDAEISENLNPGSVPQRSRQTGGFSFRNLLRPAVLGSVAAVLFVGILTGYVVSGGNDTGSGPGTTLTQTFPGKSNIGANAALVKSGDSGTLKIANLKNADDGDVYQAWIQRGQSVIPTDSLFTPNKQGNATASIPDLEGVTTVMVSAEPKGGSEQPTTAPIITIDVS